jgi:hypothetical protein
MSEDKRQKKSPGRRTFLAGLVTGAGAVAALGAAPRTDAAKPSGNAEAKPSEQVLYRRTEETNRYYRTLYR